jgi:hypothetical protein
MLTQEGWRFPELTFTRRVETQQVRLGTSRRTNEVDCGERDARVFAALEAGRNVADIVIAERVAAEAVLKLRRTWLAAHQADREGLDFTCACGVPSDPKTARCASCFSRSRILSNAQRAVLEGTDLPPPSTCRCSGCSTQVSNDAAEHICQRCTPRLSIQILGGVPAVTLGGRALRSLTAAETRSLVTGLAHLPPHVATPPQTIQGEVAELLHELGGA